MKNKLVGYLYGVVQNGKGPGKQLDRTLDSTESLSDDRGISVSQDHMAGLLPGSQSHWQVLYCHWGIRRSSR